MRSTQCTYLSQRTHSMLLGTDPQSFGYGGTGKKSHSRKFEDYGEPFALGDVIGCMLDRDGGTISFRWVETCTILARGMVPEAHSVPLGCGLDVQQEWQGSWDSLPHSSSAGESRLVPCLCAQECRDEI